MPSPFPGMDPYLEDPAIFPDLHNSLITYLRDTFNAQAPSGFYARSGERVYVEMPKRRIEPDVDIFYRDKSNAERPHRGIALVEPPSRAAAPVVVRVPHDESRETFLNIYSRDKENQLVATVEVLSHANKKAGSTGRKKYLSKQREILESPAHLIEIDLLRGGRHTTAVPRFEAHKCAGPFDYHVCVHVGNVWDEYLVYPIQLPDPLPVIAIPLLPGVPAVEIALQPLLDRCYDSGQYGYSARYDREPPGPPPTPEKAEWLKGRLRETGHLAG